MVDWHLKQIGKVKKLNKWVPHKLTKILNHCCEVSSSLILCNNNEPFLNQIVMCNEKWILYNNQWWPAQWSDWEEAPKCFPKPNLHQEKVMVTVWWSAAGLIHDSFLNPSETIGKSEKYAQRIDEMHRKPENLNACSQHWPIERAQFFSRQCPTACRTANTSTGEWIGRQSFASSSICAQSCPTLCDPMDWSPPVGCPHDFACKNTEVSCHFLLQGIFPTQELNLCLLRWQADSLPLHHLGTPIFTWTLTNGLPLLQASQQLVAEKRLPQPEETEKSFQEFFKTRSTQFYTTGINKLIFWRGKTCWL